MDAPVIVARPTQAGPPKAWLRWTAFALAVLGYWLCIDLLRIGAGAQALNPWLRSQCGGADGQGVSLDCQSVLNSRWAYWGAGEQGNAAGTGIPVAALGMAYFGFVGLWYLFVGPPTRDRSLWHVVIAVVVTIGAIISVGFLQVMAVELRRWCAGCLAAHAVNGGLVLLTILAFPWRAPRANEASHPPARLALATLCASVSFFLASLAAVLLLLVGGAARQLQGKYLEILDNPRYAVWQHGQQPAVSIPLTADEAWIGAPDAPNTVVIFGDFQCDHCRRAHEVLTEFSQKHPGLLRIAARHFPKDPACNPTLKAGHPAACRAAYAAEAARLVGGPAAFLKMKDLLYQRQDELESDPFAHWAEELKLNASDFAAKLNAPETAARVKADIDLGISLGVEAVPTVFLNGRRVESWRRPEAWEALLGLTTTAPATPK